MLPAVTIWEKTTRSLRSLRLDTMRGKFVAFAVLATLFTTLVMTVMLYGRNRRSLSDRVGQELRALSSDMAREVAVWFDQRTTWREPPAAMRRSPSTGSATTSIPCARISRLTKGSPSSVETGRSSRAAAAGRASV